MAKTFDFSKKWRPNSRKSSAFAENYAKSVYNTRNGANSSLMWLNIFLLIKLSKVIIWRNSVHPWKLCFNSLYLSIWFFNSSLHYHFSVLLIHVPFINFLCIRKSIVNIGTIQHNYKDSLFKAGKTTSSRSSLTCLDSFPIFLKQFIGIPPFFLFFLPEKLILENPISMTNSAHNFSK